MLLRFRQSLIFVASLCFIFSTVFQLMNGRQSSPAEPAQAIAGPAKPIGQPVSRVDPFAAALPPTTRPATQPAAPVMAAAPALAAKAPVEPPAPAAKPVVLPAPAPDASFVALCSEVQQAILDHTDQCSAIVGGAFAPNRFEDVCPDGLLVGLRIGMGKFMGNDVIKFIQPVYRTPSGLRVGKGYGIDDGMWHEWTAPPGYAIGALRIRGGGGLDAVTISVMHIDGLHLNPNHVDLTPRIGGNGGGESYLGGDGTPIIGICGRCQANNQYLGLGVVFLHSTLTAQTR